MTGSEPPDKGGIISWRRPIISFAGLLIAYYAVPSGFRSDATFVLGVVLTTVAVCVLGWAIATQVRRQLSGDTDIALQTLVTLVELVVVVFAYGFYVLERSHPGEVAGLQTRTDALYFTVVTMTTIGYGDVHAQGQVARGLVIVQAAFNLIFVGALVSIVTSQLHTRVAERAHASSTAKGKTDAAVQKDQVRSDGGVDERQDGPVVDQPTDAAVDQPGEGTKPA